MSNAGGVSNEETQRLTSPNASGVETETASHDEIERLLEEERSLDQQLQAIATVSSTGKEAFVLLKGVFCAPTLIGFFGLVLCFFTLNLYLNSSRADSRFITTTACNALLLRMILQALVEHKPYWMSRAVQVGIIVVLQCMVTILCLIPGMGRGFATYFVLMIATVLFDLLEKNSSAPAEERLQPRSIRVLGVSMGIVLPAISLLALAIRIVGGNVGGPLMVLYFPAALGFLMYEAMTLVSALKKADAASAAQDSLVAPNSASGAGTVPVQMPPVTERGGSDGSTKALSQVERLRARLYAKQKQLESATGRFPLHKLPPTWWKPGLGIMALLLMALCVTPTLCRMRYVTEWVQSTPTPWTRPRYYQTDPYTRANRGDNNRWGTNPTDRQEQVVAAQRHFEPEDYVGRYLQVCDPHNVGPMLMTLAIEIAFRTFAVETERLRFLFSVGISLSSTVLFGWRIGFLGPVLLTSVHIWLFYSVWYHWTEREQQRVAAASAPDGLSSSSSPAPALSTIGTLLPNDVFQFLWGSTAAIMTSIGFSAIWAVRDEGLVWLPFFAYPLVSTALWWFLKKVMSSERRE
jgi:hypothetical protein